MRKFKLKKSKRSTKKLLITISSRCRN